MMKKFNVQGKARHFPAMAIVRDRICNGETVELRFDIDTVKNQIVLILPETGERAGCIPKNPREAESYAILRPLVEQGITPMAKAIGNTERHFVVEIEI